MTRLTRLLAALAFLAVRALAPAAAFPRRLSPRGFSAASRSRRSVFSNDIVFERAPNIPLRGRLFPPPSLPSPPSPRPPSQATATAARPAARDPPFVARLSSSPDDPSCADAGAESHRGCEDPLDDGHPFDLWELARSWTPGFCASGGARTCAKEECAVSTMVPALTLHGLWPSFAEPVERATCFWPQDCSRPPWLPASAAWTYDASLLPSDPTSRTLAPAWYADGLGAHEWPKHGTCAAWGADAGGASGLTQEAYYAAMFALAAKEGTPDALVAAAGGDATPLRALQDLFGGPKRVALGCTPSCELVQVVTCYDRGGEGGGPGAAAECPCVGVRDSHYDNSCAEAHACAAVKVLSPEETGCDGGGHAPGPPAPKKTCRDGRACCPGVRGPACVADAECASESGCARCARSGFCTDQPRPSPPAAT